MIIPWRDKLSGDVEVDEVFIWGKQSGKRGRWAEWKRKVIIAVEFNKTKPNKKWQIRWMWRVRMRVIPNCGATTLVKFIEENIEIWTQLYTDDWKGYVSISNKGYGHTIESNKTYQKDVEWTHDDWVTPNVHIIASLVKRWLLGTHQKYLAKNWYLDYYLDEYTFRYNRRKSSNRWKLFNILIKQAISRDCIKYTDIVNKPL